MLKCPPADWRSVPVIAAYNNALLQDLAPKHEGMIKFIDTRFIIGPLWDSAKDWSHYVGKVFAAQGQFLLYKMFQ